MAASSTTKLPCEKINQDNSHHSLLDKFDKWERYSTNSRRRKTTSENSRQLTKTLVKLKEQIFFLNIDAYIKKQYQKDYKISLKDQE